MLLLLATQTVGSRQLFDPVTKPFRKTGRWKIIGPDIVLKLYGKVLFGRLKPLDLVIIYNNGFRIGRTAVETGSAAGAFVFDNDRIPAVFELDGIIFTCLVAVAAPPLFRPGKAGLLVDDGIADVQFLFGDLLDRTGGAGPDTLHAQDAFTPVQYRGTQVGDPVKD